MQIYIYIYIYIIYIYIYIYVNKKPVISLLKYEVTENTILFGDISTYLDVFFIYIYISTTKIHINKNNNKKH